MENVYKALDDVINVIVNSEDYKKCITYKEQMNENKELVELINKVKELQKKYIRSGYDKEIKEELDSVEEELNNIPIYNEYNSSLIKVNEMIDYVKESFNDYFNKLLNI